jgi:hypothetical protein
MRRPSSLTGLTCTACHECSRRVLAAGHTGLRLANGGCFYNACMAQIYPEDRGQNYAVRSGNRAAERLLAGRTGSA